MKNNNYKKTDPIYFETHNLKLADEQLKLFMDLKKYIFSAISMHSGNLYSLTIYYIKER